jgi:hypothetical protein
MSDYKLRIPSAATREQIRQQIVESDDFHFNKAKLLPITAGTSFQFPEPTEDDPETTWRPKKWAGAVIEFRTCSFPNKDNPEALPKEQRALHVVPAAIVKEDGTKLHGSVYPAFMYVNATSVNAWKDLCVACKKGIESKGIPANTNVRSVLVEFTLKTVTSRDGKNKWNVWEFTPVRMLTEKELDWCQELLPMVQGRIRTFASDAERDEAEASMYVGKPVESEPESTPPASVVSVVEEEDEKPKVAAKPVAPPVEEDEEPKTAKPTVTLPYNAEAAPPTAARRRSVSVPEEDEEPKAAKTKTLPYDAEAAPPTAARRRSVSVPEEED